MNASALYAFAHLAEVEGRHHLSEPSPQEQWDAHMAPYDWKSHHVARSKIEGERLMKESARATRDAMKLERRGGRS